MDVWLSNQLSNLHGGRSFWNLSWTDVGQYKNLPAVKEYIMAVTRSENVIYFGFSQGSIQMFNSLKIDAENFIRSTMSFDEHKPEQHITQYFY